MALSKGQQTKEPVGFDRYVGIAPFYISGVNMTKTEMQKMYPDRQYDKEFEYTFEKDGKKGVFITFQLKLNDEHKEAYGIKGFTTRVSFVLTDEPRQSKEGKYQIINAYGNSIWLTQEDFKNKTLPEYAVKSCFSTDGMRPAYNGEAELIDFLKVFLRVPDYRNYNRDTNTWSLKSKEEMEQSLMQFEVSDIKKLIAGNVSIIKEALSFQADNQIKLLCGVRTSDGKEYQDICSRLPVSYGITKYEKVYSQLAEMKKNGSYPNTDFGEPDSKLRPFNAGSPTSFTKPSTDGEDPFKDFMPAA